ncbi:hypothetical protein [Streptomyces sp. NPDC018031]|uniref:hypothetical protein n=1 Tax=Streptomyces sp. NPDC018031 TaxID=3365033 RepID=UPI0037A504B9
MGDEDRRPRGGGRRRDDEQGRQDPFVEHVAPDPAEPAQRTVNLRGLLGKSDRKGFQRVYFSKDLDYFAEFKAEDVVFTEPISPEQPPFLGLDATSVNIKRDANVQYSRISEAGEAPDEFDMDIRVGPETEAGSVFLTVLTDRPFQLTPGLGRRPTPLRPLTMFTIPPGATNSTCVGCHTRPEWHTCNTCQGHTCPGGTCGTCTPTCGQTCQTCQTQCNQGTCHQTCMTCATQCNEITCNTCHQRTCPGVQCLNVPTQHFCITQSEFC